MQNSRSENKRFGRRRRIRVAGRKSCRPMAVAVALLCGACRVGRWLCSYFGKRPVRSRAQYIILLSSLCIYNPDMIINTRAKRRNLSSKLITVVVAAHPHT